METENQPGLRLRKKTSKERHDVSADAPTSEEVPQQREEVVWGKTPSGEGALHVEVIHVCLAQASDSLSLSGTYNARRVDTVPSWIPQVTPGPSQPRTSGTTDRYLLHPTSLLR